MKRLFILCIVLLLAGCTAADWNSLLSSFSDGQYVQPQQYGVICEVCNRPFAINADDVQKYPKRIRRIQESEESGAV